MDYTGAMGEVTQILKAIDLGDGQAAHRLMPLVYDELRRLAESRMVREAPAQTLTATALVHEAYVRLVGKEDTPDWSSRGHFFGAAAEAMRRILIENARRKRRLKHGGHLRRVDLDTVAAIEDGDSELLLELDEALREFEAENHAACQVVKLRYFAGLTIHEAADAMSISVRTANRHWVFAKAWLFDRLESDPAPK